MRVPNEQAMCDKSNFPDKSDLYKYAADLLEARELIKEMREVIQDSKRFHVNTLENGRDRIVSLGGSCDSVEDMERGDRLVRNANAILERTKEYAE